MKTLVDIDEALLKEAMALANTSTKKETIQLALAEFVRSGHRSSLKAMAGSGLVGMTLSELRQARRQKGTGLGEARVDRRPRADKSFP